MWIILIILLGAFIGKPENSNLILRLIQAFEYMANVSQITECFSLPQSASLPVTWGITTMGQTQTREAMRKTQKRIKHTKHGTLRKGNMSYSGPLRKV